MKFGRWVNWLLSMVTLGLYLPFWVGAIVARLRTTHPAECQKLRLRVLLWQVLWFLGISLGLGTAATRNEMADRIQPYVVLSEFVLVAYLIYLLTVIVRIATGRCTPRTTVRIIAGTSVACLSLVAVQKLIESPNEDRLCGWRGRDNAILRFSWN